MGQLLELLAGGNLNMVKMLETIERLGETEARVEEAGWRFRASSDKSRRHRLSENMIDAVGINTLVLNTS